MGRSSVSEARDPYRSVQEVGATLLSSLDLDEVFATIARQVGLALDVQWCDIHEYDAVANTMTYVAVWSEKLRPEDQAYLGTVVDLDTRPGRDEVIRRGDLLEAYVDDPDLDPGERTVMQKYDERAVMEMPLVYGGETIGVIGVAESRRDRRFNDEEKELFRLLANPAAIAIGNARAYRAQCERTRRTSLLLASSRALATTIDPGETLSRLAQIAVDAVDGSQSAIYEYREDRDELVYAAWCERLKAPGPGDDDELGSVYALRDYPGERAILESAGVVQELRSDPDLPADRRASMESWHEETCLSLPLRFGGRPLGILRLYDMERERRYEADEIELLTGLAELASASVHTARLFDHQAHHSERLLGLFDVSRELAATFDPEAIGAAVAAAALRLVGGGAVEVWRRDETGELTLVGGRLAAAEEASGVAAREALALLQPVRRSVDDEAELAVPFVARGQAEGVLVVRLPRRHVLSDPTVEALQVLANQAAAALQNSSLYRRVEQQAIRDGLTGLYNHRHLQERLIQEVARARRYDLPLSLLILDIDDFKRFNDEYGHQVGDELLREVGTILDAATRRGIDLPARYGGEEFVVLLPHTSVEGPATVPDPMTGASGDGRAGDDEEVPPIGAGAAVVAERLRRAIGERLFAGHGGRRNVRITVTIGTATLGPKPMSAEDLLACADKALYAGKRTGKNRVAIYSA